MIKVSRILKASCVRAWITPDAQVKEFPSGWGHSGFAKRELGDESLFDHQAVDMLRDKGWARMGTWDDLLYIDGPQMTSGQFNAIQSYVQANPSWHCAQVDLYALGRGTNLELGEFLALNNLGAFMRLAQKTAGMAPWNEPEMMRNEWVHIEVGKLSAEEIEAGGLESFIKGSTDYYQTFANLYEWASRSYPKIGAGSSRIVFQLDESHALKIATCSAGLAQNRVESHLATKLHDLPITQVHYMAPKGYCLVVDFAHALNEAHFKQTYGVEFEVFADVCEEIDDPWTAAKYKTQMWEELSDAAKQLVKSLREHGVVLSEVSDDHQWGDLKNKPVLVDYGLDDDVFEKHYSMVKVSRILVATGGGNYPEFAPRYKYFLSKIGA